jgi:hypothetical protein
MELLLLSQFNLDSPLPTIFELVAQDRLGDSLHQAIRFGLASLIDRFPRLVAVLHWYDELYLALDLALQRPFLLHLNATMAEHAFGLRRSAILSKVLVSPTTVGGRLAAAARQQRSQRSIDDDQVSLPVSSASSRAIAAPGGGHHSGGIGDATSELGMGATADPPRSLQGAKLVPLTRQQRLAGLILAVLVPYLRRRLLSYAQWLASDKPDDVATRAAQENQRPWLRPVNRAVALVYPKIHAALDLANVAFAVGYLADRTPFFSWQLWVLGVVVRRASQSELQAAAASPGAARAMRLAQVALMGIAVAFRLLDWWNTAEGRDAGTTVVREVLPAPDPPALPPAKSGTERPADGECGVCRRPYVNPAVNTASGFVFCYPCLHQSIAARAECPVTGIKSSLSHIRRLYDDSG